MSEMHNYPVRNETGSLLFRQKIEYILLLILFRGLLDYTYRTVIATVYGYMGFIYNPNNVNVIISWIILLGMALLTFHVYENSVNRVSYEVLLALILMAFVPFTSMMGAGAFGTKFIIWNTIYWVLLLFLVCNTKFKIKGGTLSFRFGDRKLVGDKQLIIIAVIFALVVLYVSGRYAHFRLNFNLLGVYELRAESKTNSLPTLLLYLFTWSRALNSILVAYFFRRKKWVWAFISIIVQLLSFGYDGSKSTFFLLLVAIGVSFLPKFSMTALNKWMLRGFVIIVGLCVLIYTVSRNVLPVSIITRRVFFLPLRISNDYFSFFTENQPDYFRQSFLRYFGFHSPYPPISNMIGGLFFNSEEMSANNGLIADAMTNLGYVGIFVFPILISIVLRWLDKSANNLDPRIYVTVALYISLTLTNSFLFTVLLTHGLLVTIIILGMMERQGDNINTIFDGGGV